MAFGPQTEADPFWAFAILKRLMSCASEMWRFGPAAGKSTQPYFTPAELTDR